MSFMKALAAVAVGFAAAKGMEKYRQMGGMPGVKDMLDKAGDTSPTDHLGRMAEQFGIPGGADRVREMMGQWESASASAVAAGTAGLGNLMQAMRSAAQVGSAQSADMMRAMVAGTPVEDLAEAQAKLMLRAMIQAAKADGDIDPEEQAAILEQLGDDITGEERAFVQEQMAAPLDIEALAKDAGDQMREQIYATSLSAIQGDSPAETIYLRQLASALGLSDDVRDGLHAQMGRSPLEG